MPTRRSALFTLAGVPLLARPRLVIDSIEVFEIKVNHRGNWLLVRLKTANGLTGIGEASHGGPATRPAIAALFTAAKGLSPFDVELFLTRAKPIASGQAQVCAMSAIEQAMWDLQGKALDVPCFDLFGGALRRDIRHYANINRCTTDRTPRGFEFHARRAVAAGFDAIKLAPFDGIPRPGAAGFAAGVDNGVACIEAVRRVLTGDLLVDGHDRFDLASGLELVKRMTPLKLFWLEEVTPPPDLPAIDRAAPMRTAGGEILEGLPAFKRYLDAGSVDIIMPDVKYCGGMLALKKAAVLAESYPVPVSPHGPASPVGNAAAAHVCATMPNFLILELGFGEVDWRTDLVRPAETFTRGVMTLSDRPGLGIELSDAVARQYSV